MSARIKILAFIYILILAGIIILANIRETQFIFQPLRNLPFGDKIGHFCLMGCFSFVINLVLKARNFQIGKIRYLLGSLIVLIIVFIEECSQLFVRGRTFDWGDLVADFLGIMIFGEIARLTYRRFFKEQEV